MVGKQAHSGKNDSVSAQSKISKVSGLRLMTKANNNPEFASPLRENVKSQKRNYAIPPSVLLQVQKIGYALPEKKHLRSSASQLNAQYQFILWNRCTVLKKTKQSSHGKTACIHKNSGYCQVFPDLKAILKTRSSLLHTFSKQTSVIALSTFPFTIIFTHGCCTW